MKIRADPAQFRTALLKIRLDGNQNVALERCLSRCRELVNTRKLIYVVFSANKKEPVIRNKAYSGINLFLQAKNKILSERKLKGWFGPNIDVIPKGIVNKVEAIKECKGYFRTSSGIWVKNESISLVEEYALPVATARKKTNSALNDFCQQDEVPPDLKCSICFDTMSDPVTTSVGNSYCRACIEKTFAAQATGSSDREFRGYISFSQVVIESTDARSLQILSQI
jgi:hypothetical protein